MSSEIFYLTAEGAQRLRDELEKLKGPARDNLSKRLRKAIQNGDLSENADYITAKEEQGFLEGRIQDLEKILKNSTIIDEMEHNPEEVNIGDHITIQEGEFPSETYFLVGPEEADPRQGRISHESPIGRALIGHREGNTVIVEIPNGTIHLTILKIEQKL